MSSRAGKSLPPARRASRGATVAIESGALAGGRSADGVVRFFLGVPYAAPPVGDLRWRPPAAVAPWRGVRSATTFAASAPQGVPVLDGRPPEVSGATSEDCLYLNIWTGAERADECRPVFLWIHGGGFIEGGAARSDYDGEALSRAGVVVVTINYRLGLLGFLAHPGLSRESGHSVSGNYGLLDMVAAIDWVRRNIGAFGGDPERITIAGESAGSIAVSALTVSPFTRGKIVGAIAQSLVHVDAAELDEMEAAGARFARTHGATSLAALRRLTVPQLLEAYRQDSAGVVCRPVIDRRLIFGDTLTALSQGWRQSIPLLTGLNADEASWMPPISAAEYARQSRLAFGRRAALYLRLYPGKTASAATAAQIAATQDRVTWEHLTWARLHGQGGGNVFAYRFTREPPPAPETAPRPRPLGAYHSAEIRYAFGNLRSAQNPWTAYDHELSRIVSSYWVNFAKHGNPNGERLPAWPAYAHSNGLVMELGDHITPHALALDRAKAEFWGADHRAPRANAVARCLQLGRF